MSSQKAIYQGDTGPRWNLSFSDERSMDAYECWIEVRSAAPPIKREVTLTDITGTRFIAQLTPGETGTLAVGSHNVGLELRNPAELPVLVTGFFILASHTCPVAQSRKPNRCRC